MSDFVRGIFVLIRGARARVPAFVLSFAAGLLLALAYRAAHLVYVGRGPLTGEPRGDAPRAAGCAPGDAFASPEEVAAALRSDEVGLRREMFRRLAVLPGLTTAYYDFERDSDFPERAQSVRLRRVNLDDAPGEEAVVTFVRLESPVAVVLKRRECGWQAVAAIGSWLRFEDYPYDEWLELPEVFAPGRHVLLVRDSTGDAVGYTRRARVYGLFDGGLEQLAEVSEETVGPAEGYAGADWADVKRRRTAALSFVRPADGGPARMRVEYADEVVKYSGPAPTDLYWREGEGVWHRARRHWRARSREVLRPAVKSEEQFVWSEEKRRFLPAGA